MKFVVRFRAQRLAVLIVLCALVHAMTARAANVIWNAPPGCPDSSEVNARIDRLLGINSSVPPQALVATATVTRDEAAVPWLVQIETKAQDNSGQREFRGESCDTVADAAALFIALMLAPGLQPTPTTPIPEDAVVKRPEEPPPVARKPPSKPSAAEPPHKAEAPVPQIEMAKQTVPVAMPPQPVALPPALPPPPPRRWRARVDVGVAYGVLTNSTTRFGAAIGATVLRRFPRMSMELALHGTLPQSTHPYGDAPWVRIDAHEVGGDVAVCFDQVLKVRLLGRACATAGAQRLSVSSDVVATPGSSKKAIGTAGARLAVGLNVTDHSSLLLLGTIENRLGQPAAFEVPPRGSAWSAPSFMLNIAAGIELFF